MCSRAGDRTAAPGEPGEGDEASGTGQDGDDGQDGETVQPGGIAQLSGAGGDSGPGELDRLGRDRKSVV